MRRIPTGISGVQSAIDTHKFAHAHPSAREAARGMLLHCACAGPVCSGDQPARLSSSTGVETWHAVRSACQAYRSRCCAAQTICATSTKHCETAVEDELRRCVHAERGKDDPDAVGGKHNARRQRPVRPAQTRARTHSDDMTKWGGSGCCLGQVAGRVSKLCFAASLS
eukprot:6190775-Pleurochrysis_carterae.AAC.2